MSAKKHIGPQILKMREDGKTYKEIQTALNCSRSTICYHVGRDGKERSKKRTIRNRLKHPYTAKLGRFKYTKKRSKRLGGNTKAKDLLYKKMFDYKGRQVNDDFTIEDIINKFSENPTCYLTGKPIDINKPRTYQFDHKIPTSRGGDHSLENLGICTREANQAKNDMTPEEFYQLCLSVINHMDAKKVES